MMRKYQVRFGGGQTEKGPQSHLAGWLPTFSEASHGFRPQRGCHTALSLVQHTWTGCKWWIEGDIRSGFDRLDHSVMLSILAQNITDPRFLQLIKRLLQAGYLEEWHSHATYSGSPQGGVCSPILANIYLNQLDQYIEQELIPRFTQGTERHPNREYARRQQQAARRKKKGEMAQAERLMKKVRELPAGDPNDPTYRRLHYVRYADDTLIGLIGTKREAKDGDSMEQCGSASRQTFSKRNAASISKEENHCGE